MYYVYVLRNPLSMLPFYVGVGKQNRKSNITRENQHMVEAVKFRDGKKFKYPNKHKFYTILQILDRGLEVIVEITQRFPSEEEAFSEEIRLIAHYGRRDIKTGILTNMTDGGEGVMNPGPTTLQKRSVAMKGKENKLKGTIIGPYSEERKKIQKEKMKITRDNLSEDEKIQQNKNRSEAQKGKSAWNAGVTMSAEQKKNMGAPKGRIPWNKGLTKEDPRVAAYSKPRKIKKSTPAWNKGIPSGLKGLTYEEIYGPEKAAKLKELRRLRNIEYWKSKTTHLA